MMLNAYTTAALTAKQTSTILQTILSMVAPLTSTLHIIARHQLTIIIDGYFTVHSFSVCFSHGLFLWPVWCPQEHGCSLNGPGAG